jgi:hypothetical protein
MTLAPQTTLPSTIAVIVLLGTVCLLPMAFYLRIILNFILDRDLQNELKGAESETFRMNKSMKKPPPLPSPPRVMLSFSKVTYTVRQSQKQILKGISGYFPPSTLTAILGTSGESIVP